jgi:hypothetical protein
MNLSECPVLPCEIILHILTLCDDSVLCSLMDSPNWSQYYKDIKKIRNKGNRKFCYGLGEVCKCGKNYCDRCIKVCNCCKDDFCDDCCIACTCCEEYLCDTCSMKCDTFHDYAYASTTELN